MASFGLEGTQGLHNEVITAAGNVSASNDPKQRPNDANEILIKGAQKAAAGLELGLSPEETLALTSRQARRQQRTKLQNDEIARWNQKQKSLGHDNLLSQGDSDVVYNDELTEEQRAFGETDYEMGFRDLEEGLGYEPEDKKVGTRRYQPGGKQYSQVDRVRPQEVATERSPTAPASAIRDAIASLDRPGMRPGVQGPVAPPHIIAEVQRRLQSSIDPSASRASERQAVQQMIKADAARSNPEVRQKNDAAAEEAVLRIAAERGLPSAVREDAVRTPASMPQVGIQQRRNGATYVDPNTGNAIADPIDRLGEMLMGSANDPDTAQLQNAPRAQNAITWLQANQPDNFRSETSFGNYPQVDITLATSNFANKVRELKGFETAGSAVDIRSAADLQNVASAIENQVRGSGKQLFRLDPETGRNIATEPGDIRGVMNLLKLSGPEQQQLANALVQMELATDQSRSGRKYDPAEAITGVQMNENAGQAQVASVPANSTINTADGRRNIRAVMAELGLEDAQKPLIGAVVDPRTGKQETNAGPRAVNRFIGANMGRGEELESNLRRQAISRVKPGQSLNKERLQSNIANAKLVEQREARDSAKRAEMRDTVTNRGRFITSEPIPGNTPSRVYEDDKFTAKSEAIERERNNRELERLRGGSSGGSPPKPPTTASASPSPSSDNSFVGNLIKSQLKSRAGREQMRNRGLVGAGIIGGATLAGKGIYDMSRPKEEELVRY